MSGHRVNHETLDAYFLDTPSHGYLIISSEMNLKIPEAARQSDCSYEEDLDWAIPTLVFPELADWPDLYGKHNNPEGTLKLARQIVLDWRPEAFEAITGEKATPENSQALRRRVDHREHINDYQSVSVSGSWHKTVPEGHVGVMAVRGGRNPDTGQYASKDIIYVLIPHSEYQDLIPKGAATFYTIIEPSKYKTWKVDG